MHPDQSTPDSYRYRAADSNPPKTHAPEQDQDSEAVDAAVREDSDEPGSAPEVEDGARIAEAGNAYVGRTMDDDLKSSPREEGSGVDEDAP